jgi:hypothetical protein
MKHILNNLSEEEKNAIREQHAGGMKVMTENFNKLINSKLGDSKPLVNEQATENHSIFASLKKRFPNFEMDTKGQFYGQPTLSTGNDANGIAVQSKDFINFTVNITKNGKTVLNKTFKTSANGGGGQLVYNQIVSVLNQNGMK